MILLDVNIVLAAHRRDHPHHRSARGFIDDLDESSASFGVPMTVWHSFLRLATNRRIFEVPTPPADALAFIQAVRAQARHEPCEPGADHLRILGTLVTRADAKGDLVPDAVLAAIAIENAASLASFDRDFARFDDLDWVLPGS
ncbi:MAG TPA: type II toxin-antitoxin system VapC family toxin [Acidimicrobiales bacterium]|nr:type II toxin-antitoxin system VapC family toxin [Acidimicrobiales bacterium]